MAHLDYKVECWVRVEIDQDANLDEIINNLKTMQPYDAVINSSEHSLADINYLIESEEYLTPEENDGQNTIEIYGDEGELIYQNGR